MSKLIILVAIFLPAILLSQNVAINNDGSEPNPSAILDISSTSKGVLMPRLTTADRTGIISAVPGLTVFDSETFSYWVYRGELNGGWSELLSTFDNHWNRTGINVYNTNMGNIGIGTNNPSQKLSINATNPAIDFMNAGTSKGYLQANGNDMKIGTYVNNTSGNIVFNTKAVDRMWIDEAGKVGIATSTPNGALTIDGSNPYIEMRTGGVYKGYLWASGSDLRLGTSITNTTGNLALQTKLLTRMIIDENGKVAIGTTTPSPNGIFTINDVNPLVQLENNGVGKGFLQVVGNDLKIGTNTSNLLGKLHLVTGSSFDLTVNAGKIGIGTQDPTQLLHVNNSSGATFIKATSGSGDDDAGLDLVRNGGVRQWRIANSGYEGGDLVIQSQSYDITNNPTNVFMFNHDYFRPFSDNSVTLGASGKRWSVIYAANGTINTSDARDKTNIQNINYGLADIMKLRPVSFDWKDKPQWGTKLGLIAQEVKDVVSEVVVQGNIDPTYDEHGNLLPNPDKYGIYYSDLIPVLIKATQEQQQMIEDLQKTVEQLKKQIENR